MIKEKHSGNGMMHLHVPLGGWKLRLGGVDHPFDTMHIGVHVVSQEGPANHTTYERRSSKAGNKIVHHIKGTAGGAQLEVVIPQGEPILIVRPKGAPLTKPTDAEMKEALQSAFPHGITVRVTNSNSPNAPKPTVPRKRRAKKSR